MGTNNWIMMEMPTVASRIAAFEMFLARGQPVSTLPEIAEVILAVDNERKCAS
jgi:hypothetical protein